MMGARRFSFVLPGTAQLGRPMSSSLDPATAKELTPELSELVGRSVLSTPKADVIFAALSLSKPLQFYSG